MTADEVIALLGLAPLPGEGGHYRETYRSALRVATADPAGRAAGAAIYYFLTPATYSALHRLAIDEVYHFHLGDPVELTRFDEASAPTSITLGPDLKAGQVCQLVVPTGVWQGSRLKSGGAWALLGTTTTPGFEFADCRLADPDWLAGFPQWADQLRSLLPA